MLRDETREEENTLWQDAIPGLTSTRELLEKANPRMGQATHIFVEDKELIAESAISNNPRSEDVEIFYKPYINDAGHCGKWDCPLCQPVQKFVDAHNKANKKAQGFALLGYRFDDEEAIKFDHLKGLEPLMEQLKFLSQV